MPPPVDPKAFMDAAQAWGHSGWIGIGYYGHGADWAELSLPFDAKLVGDETRGVLATGAIFTLMDMATGLASFLRASRIVSQATLDMRLDYLRPARAGATIIGRGECYRTTRRIAFVRGIAHDGDPDDPVAHVAGTYMYLDEQP